MNQKKPNKTAEDLEHLANLPEKLKEDTDESEKKEVKIGGAFTPETEEEEKKDENKKSEDPGLGEAFNFPKR